MFVGGVPYCNRQTRRKVERYRKRHGLTFTQAYNRIYGTNYPEPHTGSDTAITYNNDAGDTSTAWDI